MGWLRADETEGRTQSVGLLPRLSGKVSFAKPSLDSMIAWTDQYFFHEWRIQAHVDSEQCHLLDGDDKVHAEGTFEECLAKLDAVKVEQNLPPMHGKAVILLHGLGAPRWSMHLLARHLEENGGYKTFTIDYASLRSNIDDQASSLANVIRSLEGIEEINLVGHSMGNIVVRRYLAGNDTAPHVWKADPRIARIVMIAPPNHGSVAATRLSDTAAFKAVFGQSGRQLGVEWEDLEKRLATPRVEFGIIAGGYGNPIGLNPFLPGDDDGRIRVETTRLAGASDFLVVSAVHELIANDPRVFDYTLRFLSAGYFVSAENRKAIPLESVAQRPGTKSR
jgi:pimeloyl-ACP methyl ester carboxylesterase